MHLPPVNIDDSGNDFQEGGFAHTITTNHPQGFTFLERQGYILERPILFTPPQTLSSMIGDTDIFQGQNRHANLG